MKNIKVSKLALALFLILSIAGAGAWIYQTIYGLGVTGMNNGTSWGLYIAAFMFLVGLSAGGLIVASSASIFHITEFKKVALPAVCVSSVCIIGAALLVVLDLGGVFRLYHLLLSPNIKSPLFWDICVISTYILLNLIYLYMMTSKKVDKDKIVYVSRFALPIAFLVHTITAWIFGLQIAREGWHSSLMGPLFIISAMDSGLAILLIALIWLRAKKIFHTSQKLMSILAGLLATCIALDGYMVGCELVTLAYPEAHGGLHLLHEMFVGKTSLYFWIEVIFGVFIPFTILCFAKNRKSTKLILFSSICVVVGVFCKRIWLLFTSFILPNEYGAPGLIDGSTGDLTGRGLFGWSDISNYYPTFPELLVTIGVFALGTLAFLVLVDRLIAKASPYDLITHTEELSEQERLEKARIETELQEKGKKLESQEDKEMFKPQEDVSVHKS